MILSEIMLCIVIKFYIIRLGEQTISIYLERKRKGAKVLQRRKKLRTELHTFSFALGVPDCDKPTRGGTAPSCKTRVQNLGL